MDGACERAERKELVPYSGLNLNNPVAHGDYVYFNSPRNGIDNIFAVHVPTGRQFQVTNRKFGAYNAALSPDGREMAYQDFTPDGFRIVTQPVDSTPGRPWRM
jgi:Tol biopolymer transport system component